MPEVHDIRWARARLGEMQLPRLSEDLTAASAVAEILYETFDQHFFLMRRKEGLQKITRDFYSEAFQDALREMIRSFDPDKARGKNPCNYFTSLLEMRLIDKLRREQPGRFADIAFTDEEGNSSGRLEDPAAWSGEIRTLSGEDPRLCDIEEQQSSRELALQLCSLVTCLYQIADPARAAERTRLRCFRMFYTNESMGVLRDGVEPDSVFARRDALFMRSYDRSLVCFAYAREPRHTTEFCRFPLRRAGELLPREPDPERFPELPLTGRFLQAYWRKQYGEEKSAPTLSRQKKAWHDFAREQLGLD